MGKGSTYACRTEVSDLGTMLVSSFFHDQGARARCPSRISLNNKYEGFFSPSLSLFQRCRGRIYPQGTISGVRRGAWRALLRFPSCARLYSLSLSLGQLLFSFLTSSSSVAPSGSFSLPFLPALSFLVPVLSQSHGRVEARI